MNKFCEITFCHHIWRRFFLSSSRLFRIPRQDVPYELTLKAGENLLLCSDGLSDALSKEIREKIWQQYDNDKSHLTVFRKLIAKKRVYDDMSVVICKVIQTPST